MPRAIIFVMLFLCACGSAPPQIKPVKPVLLPEPTKPTLYVRVISFQDIATGEHLTADVYDVADTLLASNVQNFEYTIQAMQTYTFTVKSPGYRDFGFGTTALVDRDQQVVIPLYLEQE